MVNKSYASSEIGGDESHGGPECSKDFNSAYAKVHPLYNSIIYSWWKRSIKNKEILCWYLKRKSID
jgi:hypothetical protein